ncbi:type VII secretion protein EsaA [Leifsonia sp. C5G2]|nr:type VII secretion protein EsaA [Leifsonia sp. C5G2]
MLKKLLIGLAVLGVAGLLIASSGSVGGTAAVTGPGASTIALVNEDEPATFNGTDYVFGKEFVGLVSNDARFNWEVVSRGVAERAYSDDAVDAVIVLPRSFSHDILTLQDIDPTKAVIDVRLASGDPLSEQRLRNEVSTILRDFNTRVVKMYFASVADNISGAQVSMETVVDRYSKLVGTVANGLQPELGKTDEGYKRTESMAEILRSMNSAWIQAQNGFTTATTGTLTSIGDSLAAQQPDLSDYFSLQERIAETNALNGNAAIGDQAASDSDFFREAFSAHVDVLRSGDGSWSGFEGLASVDGDGMPTGALTDLRETVTGYEDLAGRYNTTIAGVTGSLREQDTALATSTDQLDRLIRRLLSEYFGPGSDAVPTVDPATLPAASARQALANKVAKSFASGSASSDPRSAYVAELDALVRGISTDPAMYAALFSSLETATDFTAAPYESRLALIKRYADAMNIAGPALNILPASQRSMNQTVTKTLPVTVPAGVRQEVRVQLPVGLNPTDLSVSPAGPPPAPELMTIDEATGVATIDNTNGSAPLTVALGLAIDLHDLGGDILVEYAAQEISPAVSESRSLGSDRYVLMPASASAIDLTDDFKATTDYLGQIATAANLLRFLYGAPGEKESSFRTAVLASGDFPAHSRASVYNMYGVVDPETIAARLHESDVEAYRRLGIDNIKALQAQLAIVKQSQSITQQNVEALSELKLEESYFTTALKQLEAWYAAAITSVNAAPELWAAKSNTVIQLTTTAWDGQKPGRAELYLDETTGPTLYKNLTQLVESSSRNAEAVAGSARLIEDNSAQFDDLLAGVQRTQAETSRLLGAMNGTIAAGSSGVAESSTFSSRFSTVLSNTRATGADPAKIYEVLANPVTAKDVTPRSTAVHSDGFDYRWIAIFAAGSLIGALSATLVRRKRRAAAAQDARR